jgi:hypothetical protein
MLLCDKKIYKYIYIYIWSLRAPAWSPLVSLDNAYYLAALHQANPLPIPLVSHILSILKKDRGRHTLFSSFCMAMPYSWLIGISLHCNSQCQFALWADTFLDQLLIWFGICREEILWPRYHSPWGIISRCNLNSLPLAHAMFLNCGTLIRKENVA